MHYIVEYTVHKYILYMRHLAQFMSSSVLAPRYRHHCVYFITTFPGTRHTNIYLH